MSQYNSLKATIDANVKQNGVQAITGQILNSVLNAMVNTLGAGYQFAGVATTATNPGSPDAKVFYIANGKGTYTNFGGLQVTEDDVVVLYWDSAWHKVSTGIASSENLYALSKKIRSFKEVFKGTGGESGYAVTNWVYGLIGSVANNTLLVVENLPGAKLFSNFEFSYFYANNYDSQTHTASDIQQGAQNVISVNNLANGFRYIIASVKTTDVSDIRMIATFANTDNVGIPMPSFADACENVILDETYGFSGNLLTNVESGYYINDAGNLVAGTGCVSSFVKCRTNEPLVISGADPTLFASGAYVCNVLVYNESKVKTRFLSHMANKPFTLNDGERFIRVCLSYNYNIANDVTRMRKIQGIRINYGMSKSPSQGVLRVWADINEKYETIHTTNLIDNSIYTDGWRQDYSEWNTNDADPNALHKCTSFFATKPNTIYYIYSKSSSLERVKMYDAKFNFIASYYANVANEFSFLDDDNVRWYAKKFMTPFAYASIQAVNPNHTTMVVSTIKVTDYAGMEELRDNDVAKVVEMKDWETPKLVIDTTGMVINTNAADANKFLLPVKGDSVYTIWNNPAYFNIDWVTNAIIYDADLEEIGMVKKFGFIIYAAMQEGFPAYTTYVKMPSNAAYISVYHNCITYPYTSFFEGFIFDSDKITQLWQNITIDNPVFRSVVGNSPRMTDGYLVTIGDSLTAQGTWQLYVMRALRLANGSSEWYSQRGGVGGCRIVPAFSNGVVSADDSIWYRTKHLETIFGDSSYILETADTIIIMGGTNDVAKAELLGSVSDLPLINDNDIPISTGVYYKIKDSDASQFQKTDLSFASALKGVIQNMQTAFPTKRLVIVSPHCNKMTQYASTRAEMEYMVNLMHQICDLYNVQFVDLFHTSGISLFNASSLLVDDVHTSAAGGVMMGECIASAIS